jgi:hypothetical protein
MGERNPSFEVFGQDGNVHSWEGFHIAAIHPRLRSGSRGAGLCELEGLRHDRDQLERD